MRINLGQRWFADGVLFRKGEHEVPDSWKDRLPPRTEVLEEPKAVPAAKEDKKAQKSLDL